MYINNKTREYFLEEDSIISHGLDSSNNILNNKKNLIKRISNYQYSFNESITSSLKLDKKIKTYYMGSSNSYKQRLLIDRIFQLENK
jgi:hypothetical protein